MIVDVSCRFEPVLVITLCMIPYNVPLYKCILLSFLLGVLWLLYFLHIYWVVNKQYKLVLKIFLKEINENLSWKNHIVHLASKRSKTIDIIAKLRHFVPLATLHRICISVIQPCLLYGIVTRGWATKVMETQFLFSKTVPVTWCTLVSKNLML